MAIQGNYILLGEARRNLLTIKKYSAKQWVAGQSTEYLNELRGIFSLLALNPDAGYDRSSEFKPGVRSFAHKSHMIYYWKTGVNIAIFKILHQSMTPESHLCIQPENSNDEK
jgi:plasmid stabilization system protein ParE